MASRRTCRGCGKQMRGTATREHILPQWLHSHIELPGVRLEHRAVDEQGITLLRSHGLNNFTLKSLCNSCNNGWMSRLEADVKPLLLPLIEGKRSAGSLTAEETSLLARWAFKTAFMILSGQKTHSVPWQLFETWAAAGAGDPDPAVIFALSDLQSTPGFGYVTESDDLEDSPVHPVNLRVSVCIRSLLLVVLIPLDDRGRAPGRGHALYRLLWPLHVAPIDIPTEVGPNTGRAYGEFIKYLASFVHAGVRPDRS
jgi:hypothetical protein